MNEFYLNESQVKTSVQNWLDTIISPNGKWEGNNLHIDEIESLERIQRSQWVDISLEILNILLKQFKPMTGLSLFLHIDMKDHREAMSSEVLSLNWLKENIDEYTPPSLHLTSLEYYDVFYKKELTPCKPDDKLLERFDSSSNIYFFYRTYFDENEEMYLREVYVFVKD
jgi:hypothetical protein